MCDTKTCCDKCNKKYFKDSKLEHEHNVISMRDGTQEYLGMEIGKTPVQKIFKAYRNRGELERLKDSLINLAVTDGHVDVGLSKDDLEKIKIGTIDKTEILDYDSEITKTTAIVKNHVIFKDGFLDAVRDGKYGFSLGYVCDEINSTCDEFDFEQKNIIPHHLALVDRPRCGDVCTFTDELIKNEENMAEEKVENSTDTEVVKEDKGLILQDVLDFVSKFPDIVKNIPLDKMQEMLKPLIEFARMAEMPEGEIPFDESESESDLSKTDDDLDSVKNLDENKSEEKKPVTDSKAFVDAVNNAVKNRVKIIEKAKAFLDEDIDIAMSDLEIMRLAVSRQYNDMSVFSDSEIPTIFKTLKIEKQKEEFMQSQKEGVVINNYLLTN